MSKLFSTCLYVTLIMMGGASAVVAQCGMCGDVNGSGHVSIGDNSMLTDYLYLGGTPTCLVGADVDEFIGITHNDLMFIIANLYTTKQPLSCPPTGTYPPTATDDTLSFRRTWIPASVPTDKHQVLVWGKEISEIRGLAIPFTYSLPGYTLELDSISGVDSRHGGVNAYIDNSAGRAIMVHGHNVSPGEGLIAKLWFDINPPADAEQLQIAIGTYPPSHQLIYTGEQSNLYYGFVPTVMAPACEAWGDVNNSGGIITVGDVSAMSDYLFISGTPPALPYQGDVTGDCVLDILDIHSMLCVRFVCGYPWDEVCCNLLGGPSAVLTCCDPRVRPLTDPAAALGATTVSYPGNDIVVSGVGTTADDGVRVYPANNTPWDGIKMNLQDVDLSLVDAAVRFRFTAHMWSPTIPPDPNNYFPESSWLLGSVSATRVGSDIEIEADFDAAGTPDVLIRTYDHGVMTGTGVAGGGGVVATAGAITSLPEITGLKVGGVQPYKAILEFDETMTFNLATTPPLVVVADVIEFEAPSDTVAFDGVGPVDIQAAGYSSFIIRNVAEFNRSCLSYGDVNDGDHPKACHQMTIGDISQLVDYLHISHVPVASEPDADVTGDCIIDHLDISALVCVFNNGGLFDPIACPSLGGYCPIPTCCDPITRFPGQTFIPLGNAAITENPPAATDDRGEATFDTPNDILVENIGAGGDDGVRYYPDDNVPSRGTRMSLDNVDLAPHESGVNFRLYGTDWLQANPPESPRGLIGDVDFFTYDGLISVDADFTPIGDPEALVAGFLGPELVFEEEEAEGHVSGVIGPIDILPRIEAVSVLAHHPYELAVKFDRPIYWTPQLGPTPTVIIDRVHFVANDAADLYDAAGPLDIRGLRLDWFSLAGYDIDFCCRYRVGDANGAGGDEPTIGDLSLLIDAKFISEDCDGLVVCLTEGNVNQSGPVVPTCDDITVGDITWLIDYLFVAGPENSYLNHCLGAGLE